VKDQSYRNKLPGPLKTSHHNIRNSTSMEYHHVPSSILTHSVQFSSFSCIHLPVTPWTAARQASLSITDSQSLLRFMSIELMMASNHLILCHPLLLSLSIFPSLRVFFSDTLVTCARIRTSSVGFQAGLLFLHIIVTISPAPSKRCNLIE